MNVLARAYEAGVKAAAAATGVGSLVPPGKVTSKAVTPSATAPAAPSTGGQVAHVSSRGGGGSPATSSGMAASTIPSLAPGTFGKGLPPQSPINPQTLATQAGAAGAGSAFQLGSAGQRHSIRTMGTELPAIAGAGMKAGSFNMGVTPDPGAKPDKVPKADNGPRTLGTSFDEHPRINADINNAFNDLSIPKNTDVLNEAGQAQVGAPRA